MIVWAYYRWRQLGARLTGRGSGTALFAPERPLMGYSIWRMCHELGLRVATEPDASCRVALNWEDVTVNAVTLPPPPPGLRWLNAGCVDIRKSTVEAVSVATLGYGLAVDPRSHHGPFVRKSEENALHDGAVLEGPCEPRPGFVDQRLLDNVVDGRPEDFRISVVGRQLPVIIRRLHLLSERFDTVEHGELVSTESVLDPEEVARLLTFCRGDRPGLWRPGCHSRPGRRPHLRRRCQQDSAWASASPRLSLHRARAPSPRPGLSRGVPGQSRAGTRHSGD